MAIQRLSSDQLSANSVNVLTHLQTVGSPDTSKYLRGDGTWSVAADPALANNITAAFDTANGAFAKANNALANTSGTTFGGDFLIGSGGKLTVLPVGGDEGGEILLGKPPNGTLGGGVTIDAYQNRIRIFEQGGSARGAYIDLTACAGGVGSNLTSVSSSSVQNAVAGSAVDSVGSYAFIRFTNNTIGTPGSDHVAGTLLAFSNGTGTTVGNGGNPYYASGTWKTMGDVPSSGTTSTKVTVMLRIA